MSGVGWFTVFRQITLRLLVPSLVAGWLWVAIHSGRELSMALLLSTRDSQILSIVAWSAWENGQRGCRDGNHPDGAHDDHRHHGAGGNAAPHQRTRVGEITCLLRYESKI